MTRLLNRAAFETNLAETHKQAQREGGSYAVMMVDVDHFKDFNDTMGHQAGDDCLVRVAEIIRETVRKTDCVGRYGGEEIIVLCPGIDVVSAAELAERVRAAVQGLQIVHPRSTASSFVTVTLGLAVGPDMGSWSEVIGRADERLYTAKREGRNQIAA
jgi:diguanylate cyclase (GGDEF)-like protein